jgi:F-type H+-transporting ATPase subunit delta
MKGTRAASRYAKSLLGLAVEQGSLEAIKQDMDLIVNVCQSSRDLVVLLKSPLVKSDKKLSILNEIFAGKISGLTFRFIEIITNNRRESILLVIATSFQQQYREHKKILKAVVTTAVGIDDNLRSKVLDLLKKQADGEVELVEKVNKDLIGGFVLTYNDNQVDASVSAQLAKLRQSFSENAYISEV